MSDKINNCSLTVATEVEGLALFEYDEKAEYIEIFANNKDILTIPPKGSMIIDVPTFMSFNIPPGIELHVTSGMESLDVRTTVFGNMIVLSSGVYVNLEIPMINYGNRVYQIEKGDLIAVGRCYKHNAVKIDLIDFSKLRGSDEG